MDRDGRDTLCWVIFSLAVYAAGIYVSSLYALSLRYEPVTFALCRDLPDVGRTFLGAYLRTVWLTFPLLAAGYTRFARQTAYSVLAARAFPEGLAAGLVFRQGESIRYLTVILFSFTVQGLYISLCRSACDCAYAADGHAGGLHGTVHDRQFLIRYLRILGFLAPVTALRCCGSLTGLY